MPGPLGCAQEYTVSIHDRTGRIELGQFEEVSSLSWGRLLDDTSEAEVTVTTAEPQCCELVNKIGSWCNDLTLFRDGEMVWQGPIIGLDPVGRDSFTIKARDITAWLDARIIRTLIDYTPTGLGAADLTVIAEALVRDALTIDDPGILAYLTVLVSGVPGERRYEANSAYAGAELRELARTGIDYTALGHRLIIAGELPLGRLGALSDEDFLGDVNVIEDGLAAVTRAIVVGDGVTAISEVAGACGLLERLVKEDSIKDLASAQAEADAIVMAGYPTPVYLEVPGDSQLSPDAPVGINDLVPGVVMPVATQETCKTLATDLRLSKLGVSFNPDAGEQVKVTLVPVGFQAA